MKILLLFVPLVALAIAQYWGLVKTPPDRMMGDVYRILYLHVPAAWAGLVVFTVSFGASLVFLIRKKLTADHWAVAAAEVGVVFTAIALMSGSIWGKPTWGVWWTWDPRLTTTAILFVLYSGYLIFRFLLADPRQRARMAAVIGSFIYLNVPLVYFSVKWWRSLHQVQSSPETMDPAMTFALRFNAIAMLLVGFVFIWLRKQIASRKMLEEEKCNQGATS